MGASLEAVLTDKLGRRSGPRRKYTIAEKRSMVEETRAHGASVPEVAQRHGVNANLLSVWRRQYQQGLLRESSDSERSADLLPVKVTMWTIRALFTRSIMLKILQNIPIPLLLLVATTLEVSGDATVRLAIYQHSGLTRIALLVAGAALLLGYGSFLNIAPLDFGRIAGLYITTLFVVWQIINFLVFRASPGLPIFLGGALVIAGGLIITFWRTGAA